MNWACAVGNAAKGLGGRVWPAEAGGWSVVLGGNLLVAIGQTQQRGHHVH